jgi:hypothetical protein
LTFVADYRQLRFIRRANFFRDILRRQAGFDQSLDGVYCATPKAAPT